ncbi:MAG: DUF6106 family protein [Lachnospiraceae bacterium]|nr:DUF6106 family protein [Lachnospiraceae bacterium]
MNETYVEWLVKRKTPAYMSLLKFLTIILAVCFILLGLFLIPAMIVGILFGVAAYFVNLNADLEYEYLYVDKELTVDKVLAKSKRKRAAVFDIEKMEILAPIKSWHLDNYKNRTDKTVDYSSGEEKQPDRRYVFYYDGQKKVIIEPNEEMIQAITMVAPRKVFKD